MWYWAGEDPACLHLKNETRIIINEVILGGSPNKRPATIRMGVAQWDSTRYPNTRLPTMAPILAATRVTAIAVDLEEMEIFIIRISYHIT